MSNERLRAAIVSAGLTIAELSDQVQVDPKTVERWITKDRVPHRRHRLTVAGALRQDDTYLWPSTATEARVASASQDEFVAIHPNRGSIPASTWECLIDRATQSIDLLAYAGSFLNDSIPDFHQRITDKARAGVQIRLLFGDPDSAAVAQRGEDEGIGAKLLAGRCELTWKYLDDLVGLPGVLARKHGCTLYTSVFRFDDTLLANTHTFGAAASQSPVLHLQRIPGGRLFTNFMLGFERTWELATPVQVEAAA